MNLRLAITLVFCLLLAVLLVAVSQALTGINPEVDFAWANFTWESIGQALAALSNHDLANYTWERPILANFTWEIVRWA